MPRSRAFALVLVALAYVSQPALALVELGCADRDCGFVTKSCCCSAELESEFQSEGPVESERDCCPGESVDPRAAEVIRAGQECGCLSEPAPVQTRDPAPPGGILDAAGEFTALDRIRSQAELSSRTPLPPLWYLEPRVFDDQRSGYAPGRGVGHPSVLGRGSGYGSWTLLTRGVLGHLAALSVARL